MSPTEPVVEIDYVRVEQFCLAVGVYFARHSASASEIMSVLSTLLFQSITVILAQSESAETPARLRLMATNLLMLCDTPPDQVVQVAKAFIFNDTTKRN